MNRESAHEILVRRVASEKQPAEEATRSRDAGSEPRGGALGELLWGTRRRQGVVETMAKQAARTMGSQVGRSILRGVLGGILGGSRR